MKKKKKDKLRKKQKKNNSCRCCRWWTGGNEFISNKMEPSVGDFVSRSRCSYQNDYYESTMSLSWKTKIREKKRYNKKNKKLTRRKETYLGRWQSWR
jgi:hypothetical protein